MTGAARRPLALASVLLLIGVADDALGLTGLDLWQWTVAAGLAAAVGLRRLPFADASKATRRIRAGRALAGVAAAGAAVYLAATAAFLAADAANITLPEGLEALFIIGALAFLAGITLGQALLASALFADAATPRRISLLLLASAALFTTPLPTLFAVHVPAIVSLGIITLLAVVLAALASTQRARPVDDATATTQRP